MSDLEMCTENGVATLTMNRPDSRNALSMDMRKLLCEALHEVELDTAVRCVVLKGEGDHFMAGGDVKGMGESIKKSPEEIRKEFMLRIHDLHPIMFAMRRMPKPIIASCRGAAAGAGVSIALACDLVIASEEAFFTLAYCKIGTSPDGSSSFHLPRAVGIKKAMEIALLGDRFDANTAKDIGMINFVVPSNDLESETKKLAKRLADGPTHVYGNTKALFYRSLESEFESQLQAEAEYFSDCASRNDFKEGVTAFIEKRSPNFTGN
jgi:2-(1,2-epoxy-1,2-dihydrophenyl)acetyl-CoA isomerase|tara:strand:- start:905 stop:1699 length:795 start_codon:yes stop_codon:yes gene_type:complete